MLNSTGASRMSSVDVDQVGGIAGPTETLTFVGARKQQVADLDNLWGQIDRMMEELEEHGYNESLVIGAVAGFSVALSVGYVLWFLRGSALVASAASSMPVWQTFDPLPVLEFWEREEKEGLLEKIDRERGEDDALEALTP